jgi:hypothetical protein
MKYLTFFSMSILFTQCGLFIDDDSLSLPLTPYTGNQLRIDGYYYQIADGSNYKDGTIFDCYFFYKNGIVITLGGGANSLEEMDEYVERCILLKYFYNSKYCWGVFVIDGNIIKIDRWTPGAKPYKAYVREGIILNDTTFHITKSFRSNGKEQNVKNEIYHFREFSPKPDSTNVYIK